MQSLEYPKAGGRRKDESVFRPSRITLLKKEHWSFIQRHYSMSRREIQVAELICMGFSNEEVARDLKIRPGTVKTHLRNIYRRIRVRNKIAMLLKIVNQATIFSTGSGITPPLPVVETEKVIKKPFTSTKITEERNYTM